MTFLYRRFRQLDDLASHGLVRADAGRSRRCVVNARRAVQSRAESVPAARPQRSGLHRRAQYRLQPHYGRGQTQRLLRRDPDVRAFRQFISRYITTFGRWNSPEVFFGESYGTPRSAMLVKLPAEAGYRRQRRRAALVGARLLARLGHQFCLRLDRRRRLGLPALSAHRSCGGVVSSCASRTADHARGAAAAGRRLCDARVPYRAGSGCESIPSRYDDVVAKLHQIYRPFGVYIRLSNLRVPYWRFTTELFRNSGVMTERYDARYTSFNLDRLN